MGALLTVSLLAPHVLFGRSSRRLPPASVAPPAPPEIPNAANPDQRLKLQRPGAPGPDEYTLDSETQESDGDLRHLRGHVHLEMSDKKLDADAVDYNDDTGDVEAWGNVRYENFLDGTKVNCDHAKYNVNTETGIFYDVRGTSETKIVARPGLLTTNNPFYFEGKWGERVDGKYIIHEGFVTDCKVPKPWWRLTAAKFDISPDDRAITYHAVFRLKKVPIFYFPAYYKSLKSSAAPKRIPHAQHRTQLASTVRCSDWHTIGPSAAAMTRFIAFNISRCAVRPQPRISRKSDGPAPISVSTCTRWKIAASISEQLALSRSRAAKNSLSMAIPIWATAGWRGCIIDYLSSFLFREAFSQSFHDTIFSETHSVGFVIKHWSSYAFDVVADRDEEFENANPARYHHHQEAARWPIF